MLLLPRCPRRLQLGSPIDAILASGLPLAPPDSDVEPYYPQQSEGSLEPVYPGAFLSHTTTDVDDIKRDVRPELDRYFGSVFLMNIGMAEPGNESRDAIVQAYKRQILTALWRSEWVVVYLTHAAAKSPWVKFELAWSLQHKRRNRIVALLPEGAAPVQLKPALNLVWQVPYRSDSSWSRLILRYVLRRTGVQPIVR